MFCLAPPLPQNRVVCVVKLLGFSSTLTIVSLQHGRFRAMFVSCINWILFHQQKEDDAFFSPKKKQSCILVSFFKRNSTHGYAVQCFFVFSHGFKQGLYNYIVKFTSATRGFFF